MLDFMFINKIVLSCLSGKRDSNPRPSAWEANALPTELLPQKKEKRAIIIEFRSFLLH